MNLIGTQIGDLTLVSVLGEGGMGCVYLARHGLLNDFQAVKVLDARLSSNQQIVTRFINEGRAAVKLRHPNLVAVHDVGRLPNDGPWYMIMEYLEGSTLGRFIASQGGPISVHLILHILAPVLSCLQGIHAQDVVHRDLKPENLFLVRIKDDPHHVKLLDLGVALVNEAIGAGPGTLQGTLMGTPVYMAPEQLRGERVTARADIFALGVIIYEMTTGGWFPWQRDDEPRTAYCQLPVTELYIRQSSTRPVDPRHRAPGISEGWARACLRAIDPDPNNRPQSDRDLLFLLAENAPAEGASPDGLEIVRQRTPELLRVDLARDTLRSPRRPSAPTPAEPRTKLRFRLGPQLGAGGMAEVFEGVLFGAEGFERRVAIKRVHAGLSNVPTFVTMFVAEAQIAARLNHSNVVSVIEFERDAEHRLCLVMEYVHGKDLATVLEAGPITPSLTIHISVEMLRGLGYAHAPEPGRDGIVHRDVSPQNLMLSYEGAVKVSDFGLAKARSASGNAQSMTVRGKPSYMSPEQCTGDVLDARSDLFAVGIMMWEMLTHQPLFTGTHREITSQILHKEILPPSRIRSGISPDLEAIVMKLLARDPNLRYPNAEAVIADLVNCRDAPRDGRSELVQLVATRFPDNALRTRIHAAPTPGDGRAHPAPAAPEPPPGKLTVTATPWPAVPHGGAPPWPPSEILAPGATPWLAMPTGARSYAIPERAFTAAGAPSTLSSAASSQSVEVDRPRRGSRWRWAHFAGVAAGLVMVGTAAAVITSHSRSAAPAATSQRAEVVALDARSSEPPPHAAVVALDARPSEPVEIASPDAAARVASSTGSGAVVVDGGAPEPAAPSAPIVAAVVKDASPRIEAPSRNATPPPSQPLARGREPREAPIAPGVAESGTSPRPMPVAHAKHELGQLIISVTPWALISLNGAPAGQTPFNERLPAGRYRVRITNDDLGKDETMVVVVSPETPATIQRKW